MLFYFNLFCSVSTILIMLKISLKLIDLFYFRDNIPTIRLAAWSLQGDFFDGDVAASPVPTLFSQEPEATSQAILDNTARAHSDLQRLAKAFFIMKAISLPDRTTLLKKPRYKEFYNFLYLF